MAAGCFYSKKVEIVVLSRIPALLCDECASPLCAVRWALQGRVTVTKEGMGGCLVADEGLVWMVNFSNAPLFLSLGSTSLVYQGSQGCCRVMLDQELDQEQGVMFSLPVLV